jgi:hypothetical protein
LRGNDAAACGGHDALGAGPSQFFMCPQAHIILPQSGNHHLSEGQHHVCAANTSFLL